MCVHELMMGSFMITRSMVIYHDNEKHMFRITVSAADSGTITTLGGAGPVRGRGGWPGWFAQAHCYRGQLLGARGRPVPAAGAAWASSWALGQWWISGLGQPSNECLVTTAWQCAPSVVKLIAHLVHWLN